jgi:hypothetical protein
MSKNQELEIPDQGLLPSQTSLPTSSLIHSDTFLKLRTQNSNKRQQQSIPNLNQSLLKPVYTPTPTSFELFKTEEYKKHTWVGSEPVSPGRPLIDFFVASSTDLLVIKEENCCSICLEPFNDEDKLHGTMCDHYYHYLCLYGWIEKLKSKTNDFNGCFSCPMCQKMIPI